MARSASFNSVTAARTRTAENILLDKGLLALYVAAGGLKEDLENIRDAGHTAEALSHAQSSAQADGSAASASTLAAYVELQKEYRAILSILHAVRLDLTRAGADADLISAIEKILVNEVEVTVRTVEVEGKKTRRVKRSASQEALRAEIAKDAAALLALKAAHAALGRRGVDSKRLKRLEDGAAEIAGKLADRTAKKGASKDATSAVAEAVRLQNESWGASYRILARVGRQDARVAALLKDAARKN